jgi:hypothetical protein
MGIGFGEGEHRALEAATAAISSPLLEDISINGATGIIINITGASSLTLHEVNEATSIIQEAADDDAQIIFGTVIDETMNGRVKVTVVATGLGCDADLLLSTNTASNNASLASKASAATALLASVTSANSTATANNNVGAANAAIFNNNTANNGALNNGLGATSANANINAAANSNTKENASSPELARAREIARRLGMISDSEKQDIDVPAFMRRNTENTDNA